MKAASNIERAEDLDDDSSDGRNSGRVVEPTITPQQLSSKGPGGARKVISPCLNTRQSNHTLYYRKHHGEEQPSARSKQMLMCISIPCNLFPIRNIIENVC
jgi:hypothetical protein